MANLRTLLNKRSAQTDVSFQDGKVYTYGPSHLGQANAYCWRSPGTGVAVIEVWGSGGGGAGGQCCGSGIPGNSGAYSRAVVNVTSSGFVCGNVGGTIAASTCLGCRGNCSFACIAPLGSLTSVMRSQGGFGGFWMCNTGTSHYCCFRGRGYCATNQFYTTGCGFVCNFGPTTIGMGTVTQACACGGDVNIDGGISCTEMCGCIANADLSVSRHFHSFPAGLITCNPGHALACYCETIVSHGQPNTRGEAAFELSFSRLTGQSFAGGRHFFQCCGFYTDCGCFPYRCASNGVVGAGYGSNLSCGGHTTPTCGSRGGPGQVKITFIS